MKKVIILVLLLTSCTVNVTDKRLEPETIVTAFQQRDQVLIAQSKRLDTLEAQIKLLAGGKKDGTVK